MIDNKHPVGEKKPGLKINMVLYNMKSVYMSTHLKISGFSGYKAVDGHHQNHDRQSC